MRVEPKTEAEVSEAGNWPRGTYDFEVSEAVEKTSKTGNEMVELVVKVYDNEGKYRKIYDYLVSTDGAAYKVRHFAGATGLMKDYEAGLLNARDMIGKTGRCEVVIKKAQDGYPAKNSISDYIAPEDGAVAPSSKTAELIDDEIPF